MKLVAYLDESGTHDRTGTKPGSEVVTLAGWIAWREEWVGFCSEWQTVLQRHGAPYFHFYEWAEASAVIRGKHKPSKSFEYNPFRDWPLNELDHFLLELGAVAGSGNKVMLGGFVSTRDFDKASAHPGYMGSDPSHKDPYRKGLMQFFHKFSLELQEEWPYWTEQVSFVFDQQDDPKWLGAVNHGFSEARKADSRIAQLTFADKKSAPHLPLQAADMIAYRCNQIARKFVDPNARPAPKELDKLLFKSMFKSFEDDPYRGLRDYLRALPIRVSRFPWRKK